MLWLQDFPFGDYENESWGRKLAKNCNKFWCLETFPKCLITF